MNRHKHTTAGIVLAFSAIVAAQSVALAGGDVPDYGGGLARHRVPEAIPVPAPVPVPTIASAYYVRLDAAYSQSSITKYQATDPFANTIRGDSYLDNFPRFGFGIGYHFTRNLRMDVTFDLRDDVKSKGAGTRDYTIANPTGGTNTFIAMRDTASDSFTSTNTTGLINAYYDAPITPSFTPYVGVGIGFVRHQLKGRQYSKTTRCVDGFDCDPSTVGDQGTTTVDSSNTATAGGTTYNLAAAAMAGLTYKVSDITSLDIGYRYLYLQGTSFVGRTTGAVENLTIPGQSTHEMRVGLRFDIN